MLADVAKKLEIAHPPHPVGSVDDVHAVAGAREDRSDLPFDTGDVGGKFLGREQVAFLAATAWVADHARRTADERDRLVAGAGHATQQHQGHEMAHVEAVGRGIKTRIDAAAGRGEPVAECGGVG